MQEILDTKQQEARAARSADMERRQRLLSKMLQKQASLEPSSKAPGGATPPVKNIASTEAMVLQSFYRQKEEERAAKAQAKAAKAEKMQQKRQEAAAQAEKRARSRAWQGPQKTLGPGKSTTRAGKSAKVSQRQQVIVGVSITGKPAVAGQTYKAPRRNVPQAQRVKSKGAWKNVSKAGTAFSFYGFAAVLLFAAYTLAKSGSQLVDTSAYKGAGTSAPQAAAQTTAAPASAVPAVEEKAPVEADAAVVDAPAISDEAISAEN